MGKRWLFRLTVITVLVAVGWWLVDREPLAPLPDEVVDEERRPDYFMEIFTMVSTDEGGDPVWELRSPRMLHFPDDDSWELDAPDLIYHMDSGEPWRLRADEGRAWSGLEEALLIGEVRMTREAGPDNVAARMDTTDMRLYPPRRIAETDKYAIYETEGGVVEGVGARGHLARDLVELHSEVKARYEMPR